MIRTIQSGVGDSAAVQDLGYAFDSLGNLTTREDFIQDVYERFTYDRLNRLTGATVHDADDDTARAAKTYRYDAIGNIVNKSDLGAADYVYGSGNAAGAGDAGPHAVVSAGGNTYAYDDNGNMVSGAGRTLTWTSFDKPATVVDAATRTAFAHGPDRARIVQTRTQGATTTTIVYVAGLFEQLGKTGEATKFVHYIFAGSSRVAIRTTDDAPTPTDKLRYLHKDHLGSVDTITDAAGAVVERLSYDAFGKRRTAAGATAWTDPALAIAAVNTPRGFTGHEHLDDFQLVHMNGRVYDPALGRFMSADPFVQFPESTQGLNRYAYVDNNPLSFTDPSGYFGYDYDGGWGYDWYSYPPFHYDPFGGGYGGSFYDPFGGGYGGSFYDPFGGPTDWTTGDATAGSAAGWAFPDFSRPGGFSSTVAHGWVGGSPEAASPGSDMNRLGPWAIYDPAMPVEARIASIAAVAGTATNLGGGKSANGAVSGSYWRLYNDGTRAGTADSLPRPVDLGDIGRGVVGGLRWLGSRLLGTLGVFVPTRELGDGTLPYRHYTNEKGYRGIQADRVIIPSPDDNVYLTRDIYTSGADAQNLLALRNTPTGYWRIPSMNIRESSGPWPVTSTDEWAGGGTEIRVPYPVSVEGADWIRIGP